MTEPTRKMKYVRLGASGLKVSKIILGCMSYGTPEWQGWVLPEEESLEHIKRAYDLGINTFDTANVYSNGVSETILGKAIKKHNLPRQEIVVLTKVYFAVKKTHKEPLLNAGAYINQQGLSRKHIFDSVKASLERLQLDYIDVLQCHRFDYDTPIEETMQALHDVVKAGYVRYIGMSSCWAWQFHAMQNYAINNKLTPFVSMQNLYNLLYREEEREMLPTLKHFGVGCIPWSPLARGNLSRPDANERTTRQDTDNYQSAYDNCPKEIKLRVQELAEKKGVSMSQIALAWVLLNDTITAPIIGVTKIKNLEDLAEAIHVEITPEEKAYLEEKYEARENYGFV
ncbi:hypothetical protein D9611_014038 [Ephemerocybe angulata]|uniref:NADP-dependent oxidoreductase domain-containing protein n=1 Tax=Ephemerocybe angulata TaxID=980116 RepID=A0A8H5ERN9_9AGAR|nr:hypothetical protein D9611_014038 [Tulosesus angulatus]